MRHRRRENRPPLISEKRHSTLGAPLLQSDPAATLASSSGLSHPRLAQALEQSNSNCLVPCCSGLAIKHLGYGYPASYLTAGSSPRADHSQVSLLDFHRPPTTSSASMEEFEKAARSEYSPSGSGDLPEYGRNHDPGRAWQRRFVDSFRRDPNAHATPTGVVGTDGRVFDVETAARATATSPLTRTLKGRHLQMIAIGGSIGTGLFVGSGSALAHGGPASLIIAFSLIGIMLYCTVHALGEMAVLFPVAGSFSAYSTRFLDPAWGFAMGWK